MEITSIPVSTRFVLPTLRPIANCAHHTTVGVLAVQERYMVNGTGVAGGFSGEEKSRTNESVVRIQSITDAPQGIDVSAAQGSQKPGLLPTGALASGVPPRSKPV